MQTLKTSFKQIAIIISVSVVGSLGILNTCYGADMVGFVEEKTLLQAGSQNTFNIKLPNGDPKQITLKKDKTLSGLAIGDRFYAPSDKICREITKVETQPTGDLRFEDKVVAVETTAEQCLK